MLLKFDRPKHIYIVSREYGLDWYLRRFTGILKKNYLYADGINDHNFWLEAIDALPRNPGGKVEGLEGEFILGGAVTGAKTNVTLAGKGRSTKLSLASNSDCHVIAVGGDGWAIKDLMIDANALNQGAGNWYGIGVNDKDDGLIENVTITDTDRTGIAFEGTSSFWRVVNSDFYECQQSAIRGVASTVHNIKVLGCTFKNNSQVGDGNSDIYLNYGTYGWIIDDCDSVNSRYAFVFASGENGDPHDIAISNCNVAPAYSGAFRVGYGTYNVGIANCTMSGINGGSQLILLQGCHTVGITDNTFNNPVTVAILLEDSTLGGSEGPTTNIGITGNKIYNPGQSDYQSGIFLYGTTYAISDVLIDDNIIYDDRSNDYCQAGIEVAGGTVSRVTISNNPIRIVQGIGVYFQAGCGGDDCKIHDNPIYVSGSGLDIRDGDDCQITNNRIIATTPISMSYAAVVRCQLQGNNWQGSTNDASTGSATTPRIHANIDKNGAWWSTGDSPA